MCIIVAHKTGAPLPTEKQLKNCYEANKNGMGMTFINPDTGKVRIEKGFFKFKKFMKRYNQIAFNEGDPFILHFRIATQGLVDAGNCHPFPLSKRVSELRSTRIETDVTMAHNGIMWTNKAETKLSDTMEYIIEILADEIIRNNLRNPAVEQLVAEYGGKYNRFAFLHSDGEIVTHGKFEEEDGLLFSNRDYEGTPRYLYTNRNSLPAANQGSNYYSNVNVPTYRCDFCGFTGYSTTSVVVDKEYLKCKMCQDHLPTKNMKECKTCGDIVHEKALCKEGDCLTCSTTIRTPVNPTIPDYVKDAPAEIKPTNDEKEEEESDDEKQINAYSENDEEKILSPADKEYLDRIDGLVDCEICDVAFDEKDMIMFGTQEMCKWCFSEQMHAQERELREIEDDFSGPVGVC